MTDLRSPLRPTRAGAGVALLLLLAGAAIFLVLDPVLAWDDANPYVGKGRLLLYFTFQSNVLAVVSLVAVGLAMVRGRVPGTLVDHLRGLATVDMAITGVVNGALLAEPGESFDFSDFVLHQGGPILMVAWWIAAPPARRLSFAAVGLWLLHPLLWTAAVFTYASESTDHWVPYFFLDPAQVDGEGTVVVFVVVIHAVIAVLGVGAVAATRLPWRDRVAARLGVAPVAD